MSSETDIFEKYSEMFTTEIQGSKVCAKDTHRIELNSPKIIKHRNIRIPIHFEEHIDMKIKKLLKLGVIRDPKVH